MLVNLAVKVDEKTRTRLKSLGTQRQRTPHWLMKEAIAEYLNREEEIEHRNREAAVARAHFERTGMGVPHEDIKAWIKTLGTKHEKPCPKVRKLR